MTIYIKNMVCSRCKMVVKAELEKLGLQPLAVELGMVELAENLTDNQKNDLARNLLTLGFELIDDKKSQTVEKIKNLIVELVHYQNNDLKVNLSGYLAQELGQEYHLLSSLFSEVEHLTIEQYFISQKIEKTKELLTYNELTLSQIADQLNYSSVAYLSNQFKKITGFTPTNFKQLKGNRRQQLEDL